MVVKFCIKSIKSTKIRKIINRDINKNKTLCRMSLLFGWKLSSKYVCSYSKPFSHVSIKISSAVKTVLSAAERRGTPVLLSATVSDNSGNSPQVAAPRRPREINQSTQRCSLLDQIHKLSCTKQK